MKNIVYRCRLSKAKQKTLLNLFMSGCTARRAALIAEVNRASSSLFFRKLRLKIFVRRISNRKPLKGIIEVDECYLSSGEGGRKVARQGRGLAGKIALAGAKTRHNKQVRISRVPNTQGATLLKFIETNTRPEVLHTDSFKGYSRLKENGYKHLQVNHFLQFKDFKTGACTNRIESVWAFVRRNFSQFCGGFRNNLNLWLAEIETRIETAEKFPRFLRRLVKA